LLLSLFFLGKVIFVSTDMAGARYFREALADPASILPYGNVANGS
jgi:hypothetical protein